MNHKLNIKPVCETEENGNMVLTVTLTPSEQKFLQNDIMFIEDWLNSTLQGKISNSKNRMMSEWNNKIINDPSVDYLPVREEEWLDFVTSREDYKNRLEREQERDII